MNRATRRGGPHALAAITLMVSGSLAACSSDDAAPATSTTATAPPTVAGTTTVSVPGSTTTSTAAPTTIASAAAWRDDVTAACAGSGAAISEIAENDGTAAGITAEAQAARAVWDADTFAGIDAPAAVTDHLNAIADDAKRFLDTSIQLAAAGDTAGAQRALDEGFNRFGQTATAWAIAGATCASADAQRAANADLTVPVEMGAEHIAAGFGSIWVAEGLAERVVRLDPRTGAVQATIDVEGAPLKMQPADGRMWVRTSDRFVAVDPATNAVTATLLKSDVGPAASRNWAIDGALWVCDGTRLHRYDPTDLAEVAVVDLPVECTAVYATDGLVVAWNFNEDEGQSQSMVASFVDPAANAVLTTVPLPVDVGWPVVLPGAVFFVGAQGSQAVVVERVGWTVTATPDLGVATGGALQPAYDGSAIYATTADHLDVLIVDSTDFTVTGRIEPVGANSVLFTDGSLWTARGFVVEAVQRFDAPFDATTATATPAGTSAGWRADAAASCAHFAAGYSVPEPDGSLASVTASVAAHRGIRDSAPVPPASAVPDDPEVPASRFADSVAAADRWLAAAEAALTAGDAAAATDAMARYFDALFQTAGMYVVAGVPCGQDPARADGAARNVLLEQVAWQLAPGFGSLWVSERLGNRVVRVDPVTGEVLAAVEVGATPVKLQPADGRMWVRTSDAYVAIDATTNAVTATLAKADVGPAANRSWAVDGALWICDGNRLHRYDPSTVQPVAVTELAIECGQVYATAEVVVAWTYNEDDGESGTSQAVFVDPRTNQVIATVALPVDVNVPVVLAGAVYFPGYGGSTAVVIDRSTWTIAATPGTGHRTKGSVSATDGRSIFVPDEEQLDVVVIDASTFEVTTTIRTLGANSVAIADGALWTVGGDLDVLQRFDLNH